MYSPSTLDPTQLPSPIHTSHPLPPPLENMSAKKVSPPPPPYHNNYKKNAHIPQQTNHFRYCRLHSAPPPPPSQPPPSHPHHHPTLHIPPEPLAASSPTHARITCKTKQFIQGIGGYKCRFTLLFTYGAKRSRGVYVQKYVSPQPPPPPHTPPPTHPSKPTPPPTHTPTTKQLPPPLHISYPPP